MEYRPVQKDRTKGSDRLITALVLGLPFATLILEQAMRGIFASLLKPLVTTDTISALVPKLGKDLSFYGEKWPHLDPEPYIYWYFSTLVMCTVLGLLLIPRSLSAAERPERRQALIRRWDRDTTIFPWSLLPSGVSGKLAAAIVVLGCVTIGSIALFGPVQFGGRITVGLTHDAHMALLLVCFAGSLRGARQP